MKKFRVAVLSDNPSTKDPRIWRITKTLAELGYEVTLFCQKEKGDREYDYIENVHIRRVLDYKLGTSVLIDKYLIAHFQLREALLKEERFDIFHCHDPETWPMGYLMAREQKAKWIADSHEYFPDYIEKRYYGNDINKYKTAVQLTKNRGNYIRYADGIITVSEQTLNVLSEEYCLTCPKTVIYNTRHSDDVISDCKQKIRQELGLKEQLKYLVFAGNIMPDRGIDTIIEMVKLMPSHYKLVIIGDGLSVDCVERESKISDKIIYLGRLDYKDLIKYVYACDGYLYFPHHYGENMLGNYKYTIPNKLFDAIFSDIPFFTYDGFAFSECVKKFGVGIVYPVELDLISIANDIVDKLENHTFAKESFSKAKSYYSWENQKYNLDNLYKQILLDKFEKEEHNEEFASTK
ncbi:glycosyltransferase [Aeribacillus composti]|uniref:Glycosyltransferase n=1 Tax=Aeribacillus composti TaxID=1868734 RepID=A0ABY9WCG5_9BACI|nr:glycosyltransferase [Aeribacillus composti]WNF33643.1 glycosyltransferase [Aeribacillus composti]